MRKTTKDPFGHTIKFAKKHTIPLYYYNIGAPVANLHGIRTHARNAERIDTTAAGDTEPLH